MVTWTAPVFPLSIFTRWRSSFFSCTRLDWTMIEFKDNQPVIDLVSKKPRGLLIQLEEQGLLGRRANNRALLQVTHI